LLEALFSSKAGLESSLEVGKAGSRIGSHEKKFSQPLEEEMAAAGLLDPARREQRQRLLGVGVVGLLLGGALALAGVIVGGATASNGIWSVLRLAALATGLGGGLVVVGLVGLILASAFGQLTGEGEQQAAAWQGFLRYLKDVNKGREQLLGEDLFDVYLPYAAGFGLGEGWARRYEKQTGIVVPAWFSALRTDDGSAAFVALMAATHSTASSGSGASGAAGASGGGASGAG
jgi:hypothetical protein